jgi:hypothetical protein
MAKQFTSMQSIRSRSWLMVLLLPLILATASYALHCEGLVCFTSHTAHEDINERSCCDRFASTGSPEECEHNQVVWQATLNYSFVVYSLWNVAFTLPVERTDFHMMALQSVPSLPTSGTMVALSSLDVCKLYCSYQI